MLPLLGRIRPRKPTVLPSLLLAVEDHFFERHRVRLRNVLLPYWAPIIQVGAAELTVPFTDDSGLVSGPELTVQITGGASCLSVASQGHGHGLILYAPPASAFPYPSIPLYKILKKLSNAFSNCFAVDAV